MEWESIRERPEDAVGTNLQHYDDCANTFSWNAALSA
jgi:hypothetical protein